MAPNKTNSLTFQQSLYLWFLLALHTIVMLGSGVWGHEAENAIAIGLFLSLIFSQWTLMVIWMTLGRLQSNLRISFGIMHIVVTGLLVNFFLYDAVEFLACHATTQLFCVALPLFIVLNKDWRLIAIKHQLHAKMEIKAIQFSLRSLFQWMFVIALFLFGARLILPWLFHFFSPLNNWHIPIYFPLASGGTCAFLGLLTFWLLLGTGNFWIRLVCFLFGSGFSISFTLWLYVVKFGSFIAVHGVINDKTTASIPIVYSDVLVMPQELLKLGAFLFSQGIWVFFTLIPFRLRGLRFAHHSILHAEPSATGGGLGS